MGNKLKELRASKGWTHDQAASAMGVSRGQFIKLERGERRLTVEYINQAARAFGVRPADVFDEPAIVTVPLKGYIGAGGHVEAIDNGNDDEVEAPADSHPATVAAQIRGDSQLPVLQDGWIIYWSTQLPASSLLNQMAVVQLADGRIMVKTIRNGSQPGLYTLTSYNAADIVDVPVDWAAKIDWIKPR